jgi:hypothetical protein
VRSSWGELDGIEVGWGLGCGLRGRVSRLSSAGVSRLDGEQEVAWHLYDTNS